MRFKGPESWWIAKSIIPQLVLNQSTLDLFTTREIVIDFAIHQQQSYKKLLVYRVVTKKG